MMKERGPKMADRIIQDRLFESDFDMLLKETEKR